MLSRRTVIDQIEIRPQEGVVRLRLAKQILDGDKVISQEWHRTEFTPTTDVDKQMAEVNAHLDAMDVGAVESWSILKDCVDIARASPVTVEIVPATVLPVRL